MTDMTVKEIINTQQEIYRLLAKKQIKKVFELLSELSSVLQDWTVNEKLNELETSYKYMLRYMFEGIEDPEREQVYRNLISSLFTLTDKVTELLLEKESSGFYFSKKRYFQLHPEMSIQQQSDTLDSAINNLSLNSLLSDIENNVQTQIELRKQVEKAEEELVTRIWCNYGITQLYVKDYLQNISPSKRLV